MENINWEAMSALGTWIGAIATFVAVMVALWQTKYANKKKARLSFVENMTLVPTVPIGKIGYIPKNQYVGINFANIGNRKIILNSFWIELPDGSRAIIHPESTPIGTLSWPVELDVEESAFLPWQKDKFLEFLNVDSTLDRNKKIVFCVSDSIGVIYKCKTPKTVLEYLQKGGNRKEFII